MYVIAIGSKNQSKCMAEGKLVDIWPTIALWDSWVLYRPFYLDRRFHNATDENFFICHYGSMYWTNRGYRTLEQNAIPTNLYNRGRV